MEFDYISFNGRDGRARYVTSVYRRHITGRVLDVGCDTRRIKALVPDVDYTGIDFGGEPDIQINLEQIERLPFDDQQFDCVICTDVLEHLNNLHRVFGELVRVTRGRLIISLPNCWNSLRVPLFRGYGVPRYYGLPAKAPEDRHKWFFNATDVQQFMLEQEKCFPVKVREIRCNVKRSVTRRLRRMTSFSRTRYLNRYAHSVWTVLERV